jgi:outer membrane lipoprotein carrier protein
MQVNTKHSTADRHTWLKLKQKRRLLTILIVGAGALVLCQSGLLSVLSTGAAEAVSTKTSSLRTLVLRLQRHYQATDSFSAKFKQTITRAGTPPRERAGAVFYKKPGRMRWEFEAPQPETIVSDGTTIYDYDPGLNQVVETPVKQAFKSRLAAAFFLGVGNLERDFDAVSVAAPAADGLEHVALTPKGGGDAVELGVDPKTSNILTMAVADSLGNRTAISFNEIKRNSDLKASLFAFTPPAGADIVSSEASRQQSPPLRP